MVERRFIGDGDIPKRNPSNWDTGEEPDTAETIDREALLRLRQLLDLILERTSLLEVMWQIRSHTCNQAEMPQAIFKVGDQLASIIYLEDSRCWEVQLNGVETQFCSTTGFDDAREFIERSRLIQPSAGKHGG